MTLKEQLHRAIEIALTAHMGQFDTHNDRPYIEHPYRVMNGGHTLQEKIAGMLHDVVEDSEWTLEQLTAEGFSQEIVAAVDALTRREGEPYEESIRRVKADALATRVKLLDLTDNMDIRRWEKVTEKDLERLQKYLKAYKKLTE
ncbi:MAG TPA: HD domain-containing protein [Proteiniphilum sp.]|nr:HD domain-containing protein [Proteiniphilum sp.]HPJ49400.1 HD domain-containing protein [Proteiniphilum sp.]HPR19552.1 HD domain-containing protein [Proteiniphilum sp.]